MRKYITYNKLASLYVCFAMLHTTLHNDTDFIRLRHEKHHVDHKRNTRNVSEEHSVQRQLYTEEGKRKIFDMIIPIAREDDLLWPKSGDYVIIPNAMDSSLSQAQQGIIADVLRSIEEHTCIRFPTDTSACGGSGVKLCFRAGPERAAHLGRQPGEPQRVTLAPDDGAYWALHLVGHVMGLPHPHTCSKSATSTQKRSWNRTRTGCIPRHCPWRQVDPDSALHLTPEEELESQQSPHLTSAPALLALWRRRRAARLSPADQQALRDLYRCRQERPRCTRRRCRHGGGAGTRCRCVCPAGVSSGACGGRLEYCVRLVTVEKELEVTPGGLPGLGETEVGEQCVLRVRASSRKLRVRVAIAGVNGDVPAMSPEDSAMLSSQALLCAFKMYVFQNGGSVKTLCTLDYVEEDLVLNVVSSYVDFLFSSDFLLADTGSMWERPRLIARSADDPTKKHAGTTVASTSTSMNATSAAPSGKGQMRTAAIDTIHHTHLIVLSVILFALMGFNYLVLFCIRRFWEHRYGTAGIYRGTEGNNWADQEEEEPADWQVKVEYSDTFSGSSGGKMARETSFPQAEMTDLELFRSMYGVPGHAPPDITEEENIAQFPRIEVTLSDEVRASEESLTKDSSVKLKKRVSFSDENGLPLHIASDDTVEEKGGKASASTGAEEQPSTPTEVHTEEVHIVVPFGESAQSAVSTADDNDSDNDESSEYSSCCDSSSSSSYHEDDDSPKKVKPGLLHEFTRCFHRE